MITTAIWTWWWMNRWSLNAAAAAAAFFSFSFWAAIFHGSSWQTQSRLPNVSDGWRTEGWASRQLPHFWKWFSFFPLSRHANKLASKNASLAFLIGEMFLRVGEKMMSHFFLRASSFCVFESVLLRADLFDTRRTNTPLCWVLNMWPC